MAREQKIFQHAKQIEIHEQRTFAQKKFRMREHLFKWHEAGFQFFQPHLLVFAPLVNAAAPELAFFEAQILELPAGRSVLAVVNVVQPERGALDFIFNGAPENGLHAFALGGKQAEVQLLIQMLGDDLLVIRVVENNLRAVADDRHAVVFLLRQLPDQRAFLRRHIDDFEFYPGKFENTPRWNAERAERKLDQFNHAPHTTAIPDRLASANPFYSFVARV